jgi:hypothetical protein
LFQILLLAAAVPVQKAQGILLPCQNKKEIKLE